MHRLSLMPKRQLVIKPKTLRPRSSPKHTRPPNLSQRESNLRERQNARLPELQKSRPLKRRELPTSNKKESKLNKRPLQRNLPLKKPLRPQKKEPLLRERQQILLPKR